MTPTAIDSSPIVISRPETAQLAAPHASLMQEAHDLTVSDAESHGRGLDLIKRATAAERIVEDLFKEPKAGAHRAHKFLTELEKSLLTSPRSAKAEALAKVNDYEERARRVAEEEARKQEEIARKAEEDRQLADAEAAEKAGDHGLADQIVNEPVTVPKVAPAPAISKVQGVSSVTRYGAEVHDLAALVRFVATRPEYLNLLMPNGPALNALARSQRDNMRIPGVRVTKDVSKAVRSA